VPEAHAFYPSDLGGLNPEDHGLKLALENSPQDPISKKTTTAKWTEGFFFFFQVWGLNSGPPP
jgi:hypothetical protein